MDSDPLQVFWYLVLVMFLVFLNGFFVAAEFAMVKIRGTRIDYLIQEGNQRAKFARKITDNLDAYLSATQLGITLASLGLGWVGEPAIARLIKPLFASFGVTSEVIIHTSSFIIAFSIITVLHIVLGELAPKSLAIRKPEEVTLAVSIPMIMFHKLFYPAIWLLNGLANKLLNLIGIQPATDQESAHTEEEIRILMKESHESGLIDKTELTLFDNIFEFAETYAREIMIPRTEMVCLYSELSFEENKQIAIEEKHTRYPVAKPDKDNIVGFIHIKDLLIKNKTNDLESIIRPIMTVPDSMPISTLLKLMQKKRTQMALLIDEFGGTAGLVTVEDIIEEIVGDIQDEFDEERPAIEEINEGTYSIDGLLLIDELNEALQLDIESENHDTIGGWIYSQVESPPKKNQKIIYNDHYEFIIDEVDHMRISRIILRRLQPSFSKEA